MGILERITMAFVAIIAGVFVVGAAGMIILTWVVGMCSDIVFRVIRLFVRRPKG